MAGVTQNSTVRELFAKRDDPYADADRVSARRFAGVVWLVQALLVAAFTALDRPDHGIGDGGWAVAGGLVASGVAVGALLLTRGGRVGDDQLLALSYLAVLELAAMQLLAGGHRSGYTELMLLWAVLVPACHPPRRVAAFLAFTAAAALAPLVYSGWDAPAAADLLARVIVWAALAAVVVVRVHSFRNQRIGLQRDGERAAAMALADPLTGLGNRRAFERALGHELAVARSARRSLSLAFADLDGFKAINDRFGHIAGDECLQRAARAVRGALRDGTEVFRWGGDEFAILLPGVDRSAAAGICDRLCAAVAETCRMPQGWSVSVSCGAAELRPGMEAGDLVAAADVALLERKPAGRVSLLASV